MKCCLRIVLAILIVVLICITDRVLLPDTVSAQDTQKIKVFATSQGAKASVKIKLPIGDILEEVDTGNITQTGAGFSMSRVPKTSLSVLGVKFHEAGTGIGTTSIEQTGADSHVGENTNLTEGINLIDGAITADRMESRFVCKSSEGRISCPVRSVTFKNLKINGQPVPDQPKENEEIEFEKEILIAGKPVKIGITVLLNSFEIIKVEGREIAEFAGLKIGTTSLSIPASISLNDQSNFKTQKAVFRMNETHGESLVPSKYIKARTLFGAPQGYSQQYHYNSYG